MGTIYQINYRNVSNETGDVQSEMCDYCRVLKLKEDEMFKTAPREGWK
jgi:hypothetical protein